MINDLEVGDVTLVVSQFFFERKRNFMSCHSTDLRSSFFLFLKFDERTSVCPPSDPFKFFVPAKEGVISIHSSEHEFLALFLLEDMRV